MKRKLFIGFLLAGLSLSLGACNNSTPQESSSTPDTSSAETTSSVEASSSEEDPSAFNIQKIKQNIAAMKKYKAVLSSSIKGTVETHGMTYDEEISGSLTYEVDGKNFESTEASTIKYVSALDKTAELYGVTVAQLVELYKNNPEYVIDQENNKATMTHEGKYGPYTYKYDETAKQYIKYKNYNNSIVDGKYVDFGGDNVMLEAYRSLTTRVVDKGTADAANNKITYQIPDDYRNSVEYGIITDDGDYFKSVTLEVENNTPKKLALDIDSERVTERFGEGAIKEFAMYVAFSNIGEVELTVPDQPVACAHHGKKLSTDDDSHYYYCPDCGLIIGEKHAHEYDETHGICKVCGVVNGLGGDHSYIEKETKYSEKLGESGLYAFAYLESAKGEKYDIKLFYDPETRSSYDNYVYYNGVSYNVATGAAILMAIGTEDYLADGSCVEIGENTYKLFNNLTITVEDNVPYVGDKELDTYLNEVDAAPNATVKVITNNLSHTKVGKSDKIDNCHETKTYTCSRCNEVVEIQQSIAHQDIVFTANGKLTYEMFNNKFGENYSHGEDDHYFYAHCAECDPDGKNELVVAVGEGNADIHFVQDTQYEVDILEKEGLRIVESSLYSHIPHIPDYYNKCFLCGQELYGIPNTEIIFGVKISGTGTDAYIRNSTFTINHFTNTDFDALYSITKTGEHYEGENGPLVVNYAITDLHTSQVVATYDLWHDPTDFAKHIGIEIKVGETEIYSFHAGE